MEFKLNKTELDLDEINFAVAEKIKTLESVEKLSHILDECMGDNIHEAKGTLYLIYKDTNSDEEKMTSFFELLNDIVDTSLEPLGFYHPFVRLRHGINLGSSLQFKLYKMPRFIINKIIKKENNKFPYQDIIGRRSMQGMLNGERYFKVNNKSIMANKMTRREFSTLINKIGGVY
tara:strand:- start:82 stop:606 length:525 start_codon:yes stop_codon:yes gene_type:complete